MLPFLLTPLAAPQLAPRSFEPLPLGAIAPQGWLQDQLVRQASSLSGYISQTRGLGNAPPLYHGDSDVVNQSQWIGGDGWPGDHLDSNDQVCRCPPAQRHSQRSPHPLAPLVLRGSGLGTGRMEMRLSWRCSERPAPCTACPPTCRSTPSSTAA